MKVSDYLPRLYEDNIEMTNIINSEETELETLVKPNIDNLFKNTFIAIANQTGIEQFEKIFNIQPNENDDLEFRRQRIILRLISSRPFTETYLKNQLNIILGIGNWTYTIDYNNYELVITSIVPGKGWKDELIAFMDKTIPCNIDWSIEYYQASWGVVYDNLETWQDVYDVGTWQDILDGEFLL